MAETNISRKAQGAGKKLLGFGLLTILWLAASGYLVWHTKASVTGSDCLSSIPCLAPNEWGDLLAGLFAPIAFLWLVATVWIQSDELRLQREELARTRVEMKYNREVMKEQAEESRKQAEYIGTQTRLLEQNQIDAEFRMRLKAFQQIVRARFGILRREVSDNGHWNGNYRDLGYLTQDTSLDDEAFFLEVMDRLLLASQASRNESASKKFISNNGLTSAPVLLKQLRTITKNTGHLSPSLQTFVEASGAMTAISFLQHIVEDASEQT